MSEVRANEHLTGSLKISVQEIWASLTADQTQVLICDLQQQIVARSKTTKPDALAQSAGVLCQLAELFQLPVTLSVVPEGEKAPELIPELQEHAATAKQFPRASASPFLDRETSSALAANGRKTLLLAGFATEVVVLQAALHALAEGYRVLVMVDACGGMSEATEGAAMDHMRAAGALPSSVVSVGTTLSPDFTTKQGHQMFEIVQTLRLA